MIEAGLLDERAAPQVRSACGEGRSLDEAIRAAGASEDRLLPFLADAFAVPLAELDNWQPDEQLIARFPARVLLTHQLLPLSESGGAVTVATSRFFDSTGIDELRLYSGLDVHVQLAPAHDVERLIHQSLGVGADTLQSLASDYDESRIEVLGDDLDDGLDLAEAAEEASIVKFVNQVLTEAINRRATDVHFETFEDSLRVRYRVDGVLIEANVPPSVARFRPAIVSRLKILSHLDIAEKRLPQDGRIKLKIAGREIDVRVSVIPMLHGEAVVLRLLDRGAAMFGLEHLGMASRDNAVFDRALGLPNGIVLVTGPTGSGKTTTLYAGLSRINSIDRKIITIEDPVEYQLHGINQIQVAEKAGLSFARGLRAILRHDPDVVLIGEIRDQETASIAVQASLTGHLVFSTLHTNDAPGAITRLIDMGVEPYLVASSLELVLAQRLVRLICPACREPLPDVEMKRLRLEFGDEMPAELTRGRGCRECQDTGYHGRQGVFEMMPITEELRSMILRRCSSGEVRAAAIRQGMRTLREDGWRLLREGRTTAEEVLRVTKDERLGVNGHAESVIEPPLT
ncbi:MAG: type II/IV secretion system protein [Phycisphaera sp.]|nr:type II/IV secretion system protein [Phycisphaera sp.]